MLRAAWLLTAIVGVVGGAAAARADYLIRPVAMPVSGGRLTGIDNAGDVVGVTPAGTPFEITASGAVRVTPYGTAGGGWAGINNVGQIVGSFRNPHYDGSTFVGTSGFIDTNGTATVLNVPGAEETVPTAINDRGAVAGYYFVPSMLHAFTYANGVYTTVDAGPSSTDRGSRLFGINNAGDVVGYYEGASGFQGYIVHDGVTSLFDVPGFQSVRPDIPGTEAFDINNLGQIVGWAQQVPPDLSTTTIRGFIDTGGSFDLLGFQIFGINDAGQLIGRDFIATPVPEPAGLGVLAVGLLVLMGARRRAI